MEMKKNFFEYPGFYIPVERSILGLYEAGHIKFPGRADLEI
jgi:hypothetical protein